MGFIDDIVKIVDQVVEENLNNTLDNGELPHTEPKKAKVKKTKNNTSFCDGVFELGPGEDKEWLEEFDNIINEAGAEPKAPKKPINMGFMESLSTKPTAIVIIAGLLILGLAAAGVSTLVMRKRSTKVNIITTLPVSTDPVKEINETEKPKVKSGFKQRAILQPLFAYQKV
ncbi:hypothetical protein [Desulforamulus aquiferis]|uniref:Uncharacterized protein n=1 Tax=Desulforamulus aquiferis TaxID=1397668 RepID=A0AAW7ZH42_9FIRM|nr:hypothetical protein [Desulforamulus aquiferis]MDO7788560.1 hypothetical protein [Desulforamulus aquiferis]